MAKNQRYQRHEHLRSRADFARVFGRRCTASDRLMVVYVAANELAWSRLGISVSKRIGGAVRRNYIRRRIREAFRTQKNDLPAGLDIICVARGQAGNRSSDVAASLCRLTVRALRRYQSCG